MIYMYNHPKSLEKIRKKSSISHQLPSTFGVQKKSVHLSTFRFAEKKLSRASHVRNRSS